MSITLNRLAATGEVAYIPKHNANYDTLESTINTMLGTVYTLQQAAGSPTNQFNIGKAMFGPAAVALIGETSFAASPSGTNLTLQPGFFWSAVSSQMAYKANTTVIPFSGATAGTYYVRMGVDGIPYRDTIGTAALYSVVWDGTNFTTVSQLATYAPGYQDLLNLMTSAYYSGITYGTPEKRIEATEKAFSALLSKAITTTDVTLTTAEAMEQGVLQLTGAPTAARNLIVPAKAKVYLIDNDTTGAFAVTIKTAGGTGVALAAGVNAALYCDGTNVVSIAAGASSFTGLIDAPASYTGHGSQSVRVKSDETGLEFFTPSAGISTFTGLSDVPGSYSGAATYKVRVNSAGTGLEFVADTRAFTTLTDVPANYTGAALKKVRVNAAGTGLEFTTDTVGATAFTGLSDVPASYSGHALYKVRVNAGATGLEFVADTAGPTAFTGLSDAPANYTGAALYSVRVNAAGTALEFFRQTAAIGVAWNGVIPSSQILQLFTAPFAMDFQAAMAGSYGIAMTAATAQTDITVNKIAASGHGVTAVGTVRFAASGAAPTFIAASAFSLAAGDALQFVAPATADTTLANISFSIVGAR